MESAFLLESIAKSWSPIIQRAVSSDFKFSGKSSNELFQAAVANLKAEERELKAEGYKIKKKAERGEPVNIEYYNLLAEQYNELKKKRENLEKEGLGALLMEVGTSVGGAIGFAVNPLAGAAVGAAASGAGSAIGRAARLGVVEKAVKEGLVNPRNLFNNPQETFAIVAATSNKDGLKGFVEHVKKSYKLSNEEVATLFDFAAGQKPEAPANVKATYFKIMEGATPILERLKEAQKKGKDISEVQGSGAFDFLRSPAFKEIGTSAAIGGAANAATISIMRAIGGTGLAATPANVLDEKIGKGAKAIEESVMKKTGQSIQENPKAYVDEVMKVTGTKLGERGIKAPDNLRLNYGMYDPRPFNIPMQRVVGELPESYAVVLKKAAPFLPEEEAAKTLALANQLENLQKIKAASSGLRKIPGIVNPTVTSPLKDPRISSKAGELPSVDIPKVQTSEALNWARTQAGKTVDDLNASGAPSIYPAIDPVKVTEAVPSLSKDAQNVMSKISSILTFGAINNARAMEQAGLSIKGYAGYLAKAPEAKNMAIVNTYAKEQAEKASSLAKELAEVNARLSVLNEQIRAGAEAAKLANPNARFASTAKGKELFKEVQELANKKASLEAAKSQIDEVIQKQIQLVKSTPQSQLVDDVGASISNFLQAQQKGASDAQTMLYKEIAQAISKAKQSMPEHYRAKVAAYMAQGKTAEEAAELATKAIKQEDAIAFAGFGANKGLDDVISDVSGFASYAARMMPGVNDATTATSTTIRTVGGLAAGVGTGGGSLIAAGIMGGLTSMGRSPFNTWVHTGVPEVAKSLISGGVRFGSAYGQREAVDTYYTKPKETVNAEISKLRETKEKGEYLAQLIDEASKALLYDRGNMVLSLGKEAVLNLAGSFFSGLSSQGNNDFAKSALLLANSISALAELKNQQDKIGRLDIQKLGIAPFLDSLAFPSYLKGKDGKVDVGSQEFMKLLAILSTDSVNGTPLSFVLSSPEVPIDQKINLINQRLSILSSKDALDSIYKQRSSYYSTEK